MPKIPTMPKSESYIVIQPRKPWWDIDFAEIWRYRDLYRMYVRRDIVVAYKQTILGPVWYLLQPLLTTAIFMFVFGGLAGISTDGVPQPLFYMSGLLVWNYFSCVFTEISNVFVRYAGIFGKVYFPRVVVPLAIATSNLLKLGIQALLFIGIYIFIVITTPEANVRLTAWVLVTPGFIFLAALLALSWGMIFSSLTTKYRDLAQLLAFGVQLFMYATPVIYPLSTAPAAYRHVLMLNPLSSIIEAFRYATLGCGGVDGWALAYSFAFGLVSLALALIIFSRVERTFMDTV